MGETTQLVQFDKARVAIAFAPSIAKEIEDWQRMMFSCRQACKMRGEEYKEPEFLNWNEGRAYYKALWGNRV